MRARALALVLVVTAAAGCGKKGSPLPPVRPIPARTTDFAAEVVDEIVRLTFTVPATNVGGTTPPVIDRMDVLVLSTPGSGAVTNAMVLQRGDPVRSIPIAAPAVPPAAVPAPVSAGAPAAPPAGALRPGDRAVVDDRLAGGSAPGARHYVAVGYAGRRRGEPSPVAVVSVATRPPAPTGVTATRAGGSITVAWLAAGQSATYDVYETSATAPPRRLTERPIAGLELSMDGAPAGVRCFVVRAGETTGRVRVVGAASEAACTGPGARLLARLRATFGDDTLVRLATPPARRGQE